MTFGEKPNPIATGEKKNKKEKVPTFQLCFRGCAPRAGNSRFTQHPACCTWCKVLQSIGSREVLQPQCANAAGRSCSLLFFLSAASCTVCQEQKPGKECLGTRWGGWHLWGANGKHQQGVAAPLGPFRSCCAPRPPPLQLRVSKAHGAVLCRSLPQSCHRACGVRCAKCLGPLTRETIKPHLAAANIREDKEVTFPIVICSWVKVM